MGWAELEHTFFVCKYNAIAQKLEMWVLTRESDDDNDIGNNDDDNDESSNKLIKALVISQTRPITAKH
jgi:hypothetical protein